MPSVQDKVVSGSQTRAARSKPDTLSDPTVSVVIPCYNAERWLARTIRSVLDQRGCRFEVIVIDDGSTDGSLDIIRSFGDSIRWETGPNRGACAARNRGLALARAEYIFFLDADDYIEGDFLRSGVQALTAANAHVAFCGYWHERPGQERTFVDRFNPVPTPWEVFNGWADRYFQPPCSCLWRTAFVRAVGGWDQRVRRNQDGELAMRAMLHNPAICRFAGGAAVYNAHTLPSVSKSGRIEDIRSEIDAMCRLLDRARGTAFEHATRGMRRHFYGLARGAYASGYTDLGRRAYALARTLGQRGHIGSLPHRVAASLIGIERKETLAARLRALRV